MQKQMLGLVLCNYPNKRNKSMHMEIVEKRLPGGERRWREYIYITTPRWCIHRTKGLLINAQMTEPNINIMTVYWECLWWAWYFFNLNTSLYNTIPSKHVSEIKEPGGQNLNITTISKQSYALEFNAIYRINFWLNSE